MERGDGGAIVNVSSVASQRALKEHLVYCEWVTVGPAMQVSLLVCVCACRHIKGWTGHGDKSNGHGTRPTSGLNAEKTRLAFFLLILTHADSCECC